MLPLLLGVVLVAGMAPGPILIGFAVTYISMGLIYRLPVAVQPMKAIAAMLIAGAMPVNTVILTGILVGVTLVVLGLTGIVDKLDRLVPRSVLTGLRLGLGLTLGWIAIGLIGGYWLLGLGAAGLLLLSAGRRVPAALLLLVCAMLFGPSLTESLADNVAAGTILERVSFLQAVTEFALPQLALTLTNAVLVTSLVAGDLFGERAAHVTPRRLSLTSGYANLLLTPFGALPMCHGAGGLVAHHQLGARTGAAPIMVGLLLALLALPFVPATELLSRIPTPVLGAFLLFAAVELAKDKRLITSRPSCHPVIAATAAGTVFFDPFIGLVAGTLAELVRRAVLKRLARRT